MNTSCQISSAQLPAASNSLSSRWPFTRLQKLVASTRFVSVDLADNISMPSALPEDVGPLPLADRPERSRLMPWRLI